MSVSNWPVTHCATFEKASRLVREAWPDARLAENEIRSRTWCVGDIIVAHAWNKGGLEPLWRVRVKKGE